MSAVVERIPPVKSQVLLFSCVIGVVMHQQWKIIPLCSLSSHTFHHTVIMPQLVYFHIMPPSRLLSDEKLGT